MWAVQNKLDTEMAFLLSIGVDVNAVDQVGVLYTYIYIYILKIVFLVVFVFFSKHN